MRALAGMPYLLFSHICHMLGYRRMALIVPGYLFRKFNSAEMGETTRRTRCRTRRSPRFRHNGADKRPASTFTLSVVAGRVQHESRFDCARTRRDETTRDYGVHPGRSKSPQLLLFGRIVTRLGLNVPTESSGISTSCRTARRPCVCELPFLLLPS